jgi:hypothetical protein
VSPRGRSGDAKLMRGLSERIAHRIARCSSTRVSAGVRPKLLASAVTSTAGGASGWVTKTAAVACGNRAPVGATAESAVADVALAHVSAKGETPG